MTLGFTGVAPDLMYPYAHTEILYSASILIWPIFHSQADHRVNYLILVWNEAVASNNCKTVVET